LALALALVADHAAAVPIAQSLNAKGPPKRARG